MKKKTYLFSLLALAVSIQPFIFAQEEKKSDCRLGLHISDAFIRPAEFVTPNLSADGTRAFNGYYLETANIGDIEAETFANVNGKLQTINTPLLYTSPFEHEGSAAASLDFQDFYVADTDATSTIRIRHFDQYLVPKGSPNVTLLTDYAADFSLAISLSANGKYLAVSYTETSANALMIRILDAQTFVEIANTTLLDAGSNGPRWFTLCSSKKSTPKEYLTLISLTETSATLNVYLLENNALQLIDSAPLPSWANVPAITFGCSKEALIGVLGFEAFLTTTAPSVLTQTMVNNRQAYNPPQDVNNLRIFAFSGDSLQLAYAEEVVSKPQLGVLAFHPNNKNLLMTQTPPGVANQTGYIGTFRLVKRTEVDKCGHTKCVDASYAFGPSTIIMPEFDLFGVFNAGTHCSNAGQWFLTGGHDTTGTCTSTPHFKNINFYQVHKFSKFCDS